MTIKEYVLDALGKFWNKLKGSYITPMQTEIDKLSFVEASTVESFYNKLEVRKDKTVMFFCTGDVTQVITGNTNINLNLKGIVKCMDSANHIYDFMCTDSYLNAYSFRTTFASSTTCTASNFKHLSQIYTGSYSSLYTYLSEITSLGPVLIRIDGAVSTILTDGACTAVCHGYVSAANRSTHQYYIFLVQEDGWYWHINCVIPSNDETEYTLNKLRGNRIDAPLLWNGTEIAENANLNTFNKPGTYYCDQTVRAATLTNCPTNVAFVMYVNYATGTGYPGQTIREYNSLKTYFRVQSSGTWGSWAHVYPITGGASTIETSNLTASRALISNSSGKVGVSSVTTTELGYLSGATSAIQTQINGKQASITGAASSITSSNLATSRVLISSTAGKVAVSSITTTQLGYLSGVTSAIQTQINAFKQGAQTVTASAMPAFGMISGGQKSVIIFVPWYKQISGSTITCSSLKTSLRHVSGGYIGGAQGYTATSLVTGIVRRTNTSIMQITITRTTAFEAANNTPVCGTIDATFVFS